ncbi:hypothetical protein MM300_20375 [Evansella sp. LMS18]|uniref:hypothetical protein n=1 Tax=Evansella sp. LMS18 TaxID=2924033 RepID=UPI0020D1AC5C|nr:hypothetical protein [Evansella sp. LMS18]UTR10206.1 hypothetical protein MM300_20375 [Evansella sp. LMS18]
MMKIGSVESFCEFSQFTSVGEFNEHVRCWLDVYGERFTKGERVGLHRLLRYAVKVTGVATGRIGTFLKVIHEEYAGNGISRSTFKRMVVKAKEIGLLCVFELEREKGGQSSNLYVFQRYGGKEGVVVSSAVEVKEERAEFFVGGRCSGVVKEEGVEYGGEGVVAAEPEAASELPNKEQLNHHKAYSFFKTKTKEKDNKRNEPLDHKFTCESVPQAFVSLVKCFYDSASVIEEYWKMVKIAAYKKVFDQEPGVMLEVGLAGFRQMVRAVKKGRGRKPIAYFYGVVNRKFKVEFDRMVEEWEE